MTDVAVIGAGMTGLACARTLRDGGFDVRVFDKGRGLGGRIATRRADPFRFDHGAQYVNGRSERFASKLRAWRRAGAIDRWTPRTANGAVAETGAKTAWSVGTPGMSALVRPLSRGLDIQRRTIIAALSPDGSSWSLTTDRGMRHGPFGAVVVTVPAPQALALLGPVDRRFSVLGDVIMAPCWAGLIGFETPIDGGFDVLRPPAGPIAWAARNGSKPGRESEGDSWVVHASPAWSREHLEEGKAGIARVLLAEFARLAGGGTLPLPAYLEAHRWRYALVETPLGRPCLHLPDRGLVAAGDWCLAPRVEAAYQSGVAAAESLLGARGP